MDQIIVSGNQKQTNSNNHGIILIIAIATVVIFSISLMIAVVFWEREIGRDLEEELIYRAKHIVKGLGNYQKKTKKYPDQLEDLIEEKYIRKLYKDPISESGLWNYVMISKKSGKKNMVIVPHELLEKYLDSYNIIGVSSSAVDESFKEYRKVKYYYKWAFYVGAKEKEEMPELKFISTL